MCHRKCRTALVLLLLLSPLSHSTAWAQKSILITAARIIDGTGRPAFSGDVRITGERITAVGKLRPRLNETVVLAEGLVLAPGFIDIHNHSQEGLEQDAAALTQISQGITTLAVGPDGGSAFPIGEYLRLREKNPATVNILTFVGHATLRRKILGQDFRRPSTAQEIRAMQALVEQGMREGAWGLSTGLEYDIGFQSTTEEVIALAKAAARFKGIYMSHIRDEADRTFEALEEAIRIGREARLPVQISHIKLGTAGVWEKASSAVELLQNARKSGVDLTADCYPYDAWHSGITVLVPGRNFDDAAAVKKGLDDVGGPANVLIARCQAHPDYEFKTLEAVAAAEDMSAAALFSKIVREGGASVVCRSMKESDMRVFYRQPWVMVASDGGIGMRHPRGAGTFPRVLGNFVREKRWLTLEEAVHKMTFMPATRLKLEKRGHIQRGSYADLVMFDPDTVADQATFQDPFKPAKGIRRVYVNGRLVWDGSGVTAERPGRVLRHQ